MLPNQTNHNGSCKQFTSCTNSNQQTTNRRRKKNAKSDMRVPHIQSLDLSVVDVDIIKNLKFCFFFCLWFAFSKFHRTFSDDKLSYTIYSRKLCSKLLASHRRTKQAQLERRPKCIPNENQLRLQHARKVNYEKLWHFSPRRSIFRHLNNTATFICGRSDSNFKFHGRPVCKQMPYQTKKPCKISSISIQLTRERLKTVTDFFCSKKKLMPGPRV